MTTPKTEIDQVVEELLGAVDDSDPVTEEPEVSKPEVELKVATVIPLHEVPGIMAKRGRGRPRKINPKPTPDDLAYHAAIQQEQTAYVDNDSLVDAAVKRRGSSETLWLLKERLTRLAATLEFRRIEDEKRGGINSPQIISRHTAVLKELSQIELKIKEMDAQLLDPYSEPLQKLMGMFIQKIQSIAKEALPKEHFDILFNRLEVEMEGWEEEAENLLR